jgi:hypothetical protein
LRNWFAHNGHIGRDVFRLRVALALTLLSLAGPLVANAAGAFPIVDWEQARTAPRTDTGDYSPYVSPQFKSTRSLSETTHWLKSAMERYGGIPEGGSSDPTSAFQVNNVRFNGCTMQWVERRTIEKGRVIQDDDYTLALRDISEQPGTLQVGRDSLTVSLSSAGTPNPLRFIERVQHREDGVVTSNSQVSRTDNSFVLTLQGKDDISRRIGTALIHAGRLCRGASSAR